MPLLRYEQAAHLGGCGAWRCPDVEISGSPRTIIARFQHFEQEFHRRRGITALPSPPMSEKRSDMAGGRSVPSARSTVCGRSRRRDVADLSCGTRSAITVRNLEELIRRKKTLHTVKATASLLGVFALTVPLSTWAATNVELWTPYDTHCKII
jgi:hypothetical protein